MKPIIGITMGDPAGIGGEITVKALEHADIYQRCIPLVIGDYEAIADAIRFTGSSLTTRKIDDPAQAEGVHGCIDLIDMGFLDEGGWKYKEVSALCGKAAFEYIIKGIDLALDDKLHAVVTGPINKESINLAGHHYSGHTEIFADKTGVKNYTMLLMSDSLRVTHVTTHVSMRNACDRIKKERVLSVIRLTDETMRLLGVESPKIAVAGFNAHSGENGLFGDEEINEIIPAIETARAEGINAEGPVPPDTVFVKAMGGQYDIVVAMYHDQGHIPLKLSGFKLDLATNTYSSMSGVNCTMGLPIIRSSVDHGTAFGKAGDNRANEESLVDAINVAIDMAKNKFKL